MSKKINAATIKLEKNIEMPKANRNKYPWDKMDVGDSFEVPADVSVVNFRRAACIAGAIRQRKFSVRRMPDKSLRCWRVE